MPARPRRRPLLAAAGLGLSAVLGGCSMIGGSPAAPTPVVAAPPPPPSDPVAAFAASAVPGQSGVVVQNGRSLAVRLDRAYNAGSGRECRTVQFTGAGGGAVYCNDPTLGWVAARPLLRGGAVARP